MSSLRLLGRHDRGRSRPDASTPACSGSLSGFTKSEQSHTDRLLRMRQNHCAPRPMEDAGRNRGGLLLGQVVFLFGFDGVMVTVGTDRFMPVGMMMRSLFKLSPSRSAQSIDEE